MVFMFCITKKKWVSDNPMAVGFWVRLKIFYFKKRLTKFCLFARLYTKTVLRFTV